MNPNIRSKSVVGNWKMHTTSAEAKALAQGIVDGLGSDVDVSVILCPPFPYLALIGEIVKGSPIALGAQNMYPEKKVPSPARSARRCFSTLAAST